MKVICIPLGPVQANCYVIIQDGKALLIDPGDRFEDLKHILERNHATLEAVLLTHTHFDHIGGLDALLKEFHVDVYMNPLEFSFLSSADLNGSSAFGGYLSSTARPLPVHEGENEIGGFMVEALTLPGHTRGSTVYIIGNTAFTGDVLFQGSVGRTDLPTGSWQEMQESIAVLKTLPDDLIVYPGHGPATTIGQEKSWNPYFR